MSEKIKTGVPRRAFLGAFSKAGLFGAIASSPLAAFSSGSLESLAAYPAAGHVFLTQPYLQSPNGSNMCIRWITNKFSYSWVEYGEGDQLDKKAHAMTDGLIDAYNRINCITLHDLKPGVVYKYKVCSKEITDFQPYELTYGETISSEIKTFKTRQPDAKEVSWLVMNDIHDRPASFAQLMALNKGAAFDYVFLNGDIFDYQTDEQQLIDHLIAPCTDLFACATPLMFVRGNHETRGKYAREIKHYFSNFGNGQYFTFKHGPVFTVALDTGEDKPDDHPVYGGIVDFDEYRRQQARWLEEELKTDAAKKSPFRVVMMHIPPFYSGDWHGTMHLRELFTPLFNKYKVDMVISGHTHKHGIHEPVKGQHDFPVIIGGGPQEGIRTIMQVNANQQTLSLRMIGDTGAEVGKYTVNRKK